jgi:hypothetical protein
MSAAGPLMPRSVQCLSDVKGRQLKPARANWTMARIAFAFRRGSPPTTAPAPRALVSTLDRAAHEWPNVNLAERKMENWVRCIPTGTRLLNWESHEYSSFASTAFHNKFPKKFSQKKPDQAVPFFGGATQRFPKTVPLDMGPAQATQLMRAADLTSALAP